MQIMEKKVIPTVIKDFLEYLEAVDSQGITVHLHFTQLEGFIPSTEHTMSMPIPLPIMYHNHLRTINILSLTKNTILQVKAILTYQVKKIIQNKRKRLLMKKKIHY